MTTATATCTCELAHYTVTGIPVIVSLDNACPTHGCPELAPATEFTHRGFTCTPAAGRWVIAADAPANKSYRKVYGIKADGRTLVGNADAVRQELDRILELAAPRPALRDCRGWVWDEQKQRKVKCQATLSRYAQSNYCSNCRQA